jgi:hypothetical protein
MIGGLRIMPFLYLLAGIAAVWLIWCAFDAYGDYRAGQVHQLYAAAATAINEDLGKFAGEDNDRAVKTLAALKAAADKAAQVHSTLPYSAEQAAAINAIRGVGIHVE